MGEKEDRCHPEHSVTSDLVATGQFICSLDRKVAQLFFAHFKVVQN